MRRFLACALAAASAVQLRPVPRRAVGAAAAAAAAAASLPLLALPRVASAAPAVNTDANYLAKSARRVEERHVADVAADGTVTYETVTRLTGEATGFDLTKREDISERIFGAAVRADWPASPPWNPRDFKRIDESDDAGFYAPDKPRFAYHVDEGAVAALANYYKGELKPGGDVLDLCSSWVSHYPEAAKLGRVAGVGMNARELDANGRLTERVVRDLNTNPTLPFADNSFDAVTLVVSVDYLTKPVEVLKEARRVLRRGGKIIISQSNRLFMTKAVAMWLGMGDEAHLELIGQYLYYAGFDVPAKAFDITAKGRGARDPMYVVKATAP